ncbi:hypothetical protein PYW08_015814 [Mythimna loreyi]|uniref:Uncharacterized protein n=1 Tax=Mythimna loreyi TaxID=667449 RepID=A0ACC2QRW2_9NEOP|nr:hypothetical protein PYW08_015814 [Mythimna loreyi]
MSFYVRSITLSIAVLIVATNQQSDIKPLDCPKNEVYYSCALYRCQRTCRQRIKNVACPSLPLALNCYLPTCECIDGFYRNSSGTCVPERECVNEIFFNN